MYPTARSALVRLRLSTACGIEPAPAYTTPSRSANTASIPSSGVDGLVLVRNRPIWRILAHFGSSIGVGFRLAVFQRLALGEHRCDVVLEHPARIVWQTGIGSRDVVGSRDGCRGRRLVRRAHGFRDLVDLGAFVCRIDLVELHLVDLHELGF